MAAAQATSKIDDIVESIERLQLQLKEIQSQVRAFVKQAAFTFQMPQTSPAGSGDDDVKFAVERRQSELKSSMLLFLSSRVYRFLLVPILTITTVCSRLAASAQAQARLAAFEKASRAHH